MPRQNRVALPLALSSLCLVSFFKRRRSLGHPSREARRTYLSSRVAAARFSRGAVFSRGRDGDCGRGAREAEGGRTGGEEGRGRTDLGRCRGVHSDRGGGACVEPGGAIRVHGKTKACSGAFRVVLGGGRHAREAKGAYVKDFFNYYVPGQ